MKKVCFLPLVVLVLLFPLSGYCQNAKEKKEELTIHVDKKNASGESAKDGSIKITVTGGTSPYTISYFSPLAPPSHITGNNRKIEKISSGEYLIVVQDHSGKIILKEIKIEHNE